MERSRRALADVWEAIGFVDLSEFPLRLKISAEPSCVSRHVTDPDPVAVRFDYTWLDSDGIPQSIHRREILPVTVIENVRYDMRDRIASMAQDFVKSLFRHTVRVGGKYLERLP